MTASSTSRTAEYMALFRALESGRGAARLFDDPLALGFLRPSLRAAVRLARVPLVGEVVPWLLDHRWPGARSSGVARTRFIDDAVESAIAGGIDQVVLLGAGFDARAQRLASMASVRVFELDRPPTQVAKRAALYARGEPPGSNVRYVEADLDRQALDEVLEASGVDPERPACFVWEGVTHYLTSAAVDSALCAIGRACSGGVAVFTYVHRDVLTGEAFRGAATMRRTVSGVGEPWVFGFDPAEVPAYLRVRGLELLEDLGADDYRARYWGTRGAALPGYAFYRVVRARIAGGAGAPS